MITYLTDTLWTTYVENSAREFGWSHHGNGLDHKIGMYGELAFGRYLLQHDLPFVYTADDKAPWDFEVRGELIDVKTRKITCTPRRHYENHVKAAQEDHPSTMYVFAFATWPACLAAPTHVHLTTYAAHDQFHKHPKRVFRKKGDKMGTKVCTEDCYSLEGKYLPPMNNINLTLNHGWVDGSA